jgi:hypothetical protein
VQRLAAFRITLATDSDLDLLHVHQTLQQPIVRQRRAWILEKQSLLHIEKRALGELFVSEIIVRVKRAESDTTWSRRNDCSVKSHRVARDFGASEEDLAVNGRYYKTLLCCCSAGKSERLRVKRGDFAVGV